ncbi:MFS transporter [Nonomuraea sp. NPDC050404]|uniref:MFS transporter n=1 Tax=Nonomuraea sp. NPDC050404 TaxID=3155783 RepID=UPI0033E67A08
MSTVIIRPARTLRAAPFLAFAGFGAFWGVWGAGLPLLRAQAGVSDARFGVALLLVGLGALPAMLLTGRLVDALGLRVAGVLLVLLGALGVVLSLASVSYAGLCAGILAVGAGSGAADVAINTLAATVEKRTGRPVVARSHAAFSATVAVASLGAGALTTMAGGLLVIFTAAAVIVMALGLAVIAATRSTAAQTTAPEAAQETAREVAREVARETAREVARKTAREAAQETAREVVREVVREAAQETAGAGSRDVPARRAGRVPWRVALLVIGMIGALAFAAENAYQTWAAVLLTDAFTAAPALAAVAPAAFATTSALARLTFATATLRHPVATLVAGGVIATAGGVLTASAVTLPLALTGIVAAAVGTSALYPTLLSYGLRPVPDASRGRATSTISTVAYLGYLAGPAYFGLLADAMGVQRAFTGVAALTALFLATLPVLAALKSQSR